MNDRMGEARRYHWQSEALPGFFESPHTAVEGRNVGAIVNLADARAERSRAAGLELARGGPDRTISVLRQFRRVGQCGTASIRGSRGRHATLTAFAAAASSRSANVGCDASTTPRNPRRRGRRRTKGLCGLVARSGRRRAHGRGSGFRRGSAPWGAVAIFRSGAFFAGPWRQGWVPVPDTDQGLGRNHPAAQACRRSCEIGLSRYARSHTTSRCPGALARKHGRWADIRGDHRGEHQKSKSLGGRTV